MASYIIATDVALMLEFRVKLERERGGQEKEMEVFCLTT
jgi:hypothetical protein